MKVKKHIRIKCPKELFIGSFERLTLSEIKKKLINNHHENPKISQTT